MYCKDVFSNRDSEIGVGDYSTQFFEEIHEKLRMLHGKAQLIESSTSITEDALLFLLNCKDEEFLDFVEYIFKVKCLFHVYIDENKIVDQINQLFLSEGVDYELTSMVKETVVEPVHAYPSFGREGTVIKTRAHPRIIRKDQQLTHAQIIKPALEFLTDPKLKTANVEFLEAFEDYKNKDYGDCLTKCCSTFESVMKIICDEKGWTYQQTDAANKLIKIIIDNSNLESFFEQPFVGIATLRNKLSRSHGAGTQPRQVSKPRAELALNMTASVIVFLINEVR